MHRWNASFAQAKREVIDYIIGYYSQVRSHRHNDGLAPNLDKEKYWNEYNTVAKKLDHYKKSYTITRVWPKIII